MAFTSDTKMQHDKFSFIDLFAGIGGFKMALSNNGGNCLGFSEINKDAIKTYCENFNISEDFNLGDITKIKGLAEHDMLTAGVPCQSWSIAGRNLGFDDDRGQLWNDTIFLLKQSQPKAFIFENVKGLVDPRNKTALQYILDRIKQTGYYANFFVINSFDYGVPQNRVRVYIIGFKNKKHFDKFTLPDRVSKKIKLCDILGINVNHVTKPNRSTQKDLSGNVLETKGMSLSSTNGFNDYFLFNDIRNGHTTIHSWDILNTTERQKHICLLLLRNRRKSEYGDLDGNPLSLKHLQQLDPSILQEDIDGLLELEIFKAEEYAFEIIPHEDNILSDGERLLLSYSKNNFILIDSLKAQRKIKIEKISIPKSIEALKEKGVIKVTEIRYDFKNTKISTGLYGVNRIFLPTSDIFPTLVSSDSNDFITEEIVSAKNNNEFKANFINNIYNTKKYRRITKSEACLIQGFPKDFKLPESRARWMRLIGNSVSVPVINLLCKAIIETGVFDQGESAETQRTKAEHAV